jgi:hypothetical protein
VLTRCRCRARNYWTHPHPQCSARSAVPHCPEKMHSVCVCACVRVGATVNLLHNTTDPAHPATACSRVLRNITDPAHPPSHTRAAVHCAILLMQPVSCICRLLRDSVPRYVPADPPFLAPPHARKQRSSSLAQDNNNNTRHMESLKKQVRGSRSQHTTRI